MGMIAGETHTDFFYLLVGVLIGIDIGSSRSPWRWAPLVALLVVILFFRYVVPAFFPAAEAYLAIAFLIPLLGWVVVMQRRRRLFSAKRSRRSLSSLDCFSHAYEFRNFRNQSGVSSRLTLRHGKFLSFVDKTSSSPRNEYVLVHPGFSEEKRNRRRLGLSKA